MPSPRPNRLVIAGPTISFRIPHGDLNTLNMGCSRLRHYLGKLVIGRDLELWDHLLALSDEVNRLAGSTQSSHRVQADAIAIAALMFGLRGIRQLAQRDPSPLLDLHARKAGKIMGKLEPLRKRALRLHLKSGPTNSYEEWRRRWLRFLGSVRHDQKPTRVSNGVLGLQKRTVGWILVNTKEVLRLAGIWVPADRDLRPIVRVALRHVRRERATIWTRDLLEPTEAGKEFIRDFIGDRVNRLKWSRFWAKSQGRTPQADDEEDSVFEQLMEHQRDLEIFAEIEAESSGLETKPCGSQETEGSAPGVGHPIQAVSPGAGAQAG